MTLSAPQTALAVGAHPDDIEGACGGTITNWAAQGTAVYYLITTNGENGGGSCEHGSEELIEIRADEQRHAANLLGVKEVVILPHADGFLEYTAAREAVVHHIRLWKPDVVLTHDPSVWFNELAHEINHVDHRTTGEATLDAVHVFARGRLQYPEHFDQGLAPHRACHLLLWSTNKPNHYESITREHLDLKVQARCRHQSQTKDAKLIAEWIEYEALQSGDAVGMDLAEAFWHLDLCAKWTARLERAGS